MPTSTVEQRIRDWQRFPGSLDAVIKLREAMYKEGVFEVIVANGATLDSPITEIEVEETDGTQ